ncbi:hypothetical protein WL19_33625 [Burkholderia ubonensis]|uniref:KTSC domain-containing protein n=1 Tax=Burkholderia ubonensis TaxID=101571 RepID=A0ABD4DWR5_9BURK|nr:hypothetical protein WJ68_20890 [Burkholderia ubonensis]KVZ60083.1 hypothetical protein WL19_33625 [Burkholderia ubonensis]KVZ82284.1 hypothetical protein WL24_15940 [Burkholderia ubonensis]
MTIYLNLSGKSGVASYEAGDDFIMVEFKQGAFRRYFYTHITPGPMHVEVMKKLATQGCGLNSYINSHPAVKYGYASRE